MTDSNMIQALEKIRDSVQVHGGTALSQIGKTFSQYEGKKAIKEQDQNEMAVALHENGVAISDQEAGTLSKYFDKDSTGGTNFNKVFIGKDVGLDSSDKLMRTNMHFNKDGSGELVLEELQGNFDLENHPKYKSGELSKSELFSELAKQQQIGEGPSHHGYNRLVASIDDQNNFNISSSSGWKDYY